MQVPEVHLKAFEQAVPGYEYLEYSLEWQGRRGYRGWKDEEMGERLGVEFQGGMFTWPCRLLVPWEGDSLTRAGRRLSEACSLEQGL